MSSAAVHFFPMFGPPTEFARQLDCASSLMALKGVDSVGVLERRNIVMSLTAPPGVGLVLRPDYQTPESGKWALARLGLRIVCNQKGEKILIHQEGVEPCRTLKEANAKVDETLRAYRCISQANAVFENMNRKK